MYSATQNPMPYNDRNNNVVCRGFALGTILVSGALYIEGVNSLVFISKKKIYFSRCVLLCVVA